MPLRHHIVAIALLWVAAIGWLFYREFLPYLRPNVPPPFTIDLIDQAPRQVGEVEWEITRNARGKYRLKTSVKYHKEDDTFEMESNLTTQFQDRDGKKQDEDLKVDWKCRVAWDGTLRRHGIDATVHFPEKRASGQETKEGTRAKAEFKMQGDVRDGLLYSHWKGEVSLVSGEKGTPLSSAIKIERDAEPIPVAGRNSLLNPLVPLNRMPHLRPGQYWRIVPFDPIADTLSFAGAGAAGSGKPTEARVRPHAVPYQWRDKEVACLVVDYEAEGLKASTWVRERDGLVLKQEASIGGEEWVMERTKE